MPIKPENRAKYPKDWKTVIVPRIRERSGDKCERCGVDNGARGARDVDGRFWTCEEMELNPVRLHPWAKALTIVLTCAHLDHDPTNNNDSNLAHLCQKCHLGHDAGHHRKNAAATIARKQDARNGQTRLF